MTLPGPEKTDRPLRILHMAATAQGASWMVAFLREQRRIGHDVSAAISEGDGALYDTLVREGIETHRLPLDLFVSRGPVDAVRRLGRVVALLRKLRPDVVHSHILQTNVIARLAAWVADVPLPMSMSTGPFPLESEVLRVVDVGTTWADVRTIASCEATRDLYARYGVPRDKLELIHYAVDQTGYDPGLADGARVRRELGIANGAPLIGIVAYFYPPLRHPTVTPPHLLGRGVKGHDVLIHAAPRVLEEFPEAKFALVGREWGATATGYEQELRDLAAALAPGAVLFPGERHDVPDTLAAFDVSVHCSLSENLGGTVESLLMARPMVVSAVGGMVDTVRHESTGLVVPPDDPAALAAAIVRLLRDPERARRLGEKGRELMLERYSLSRSIRDFEDLYRRAGSTVAPAGRPPRESRYRLARTLARAAALPVRTAPMARRLRRALAGPAPATAPRTGLPHPGVVALGALRAVTRFARTVLKPTRPPGTGAPLRVAEIAGAWQNCEWFVDLCAGLEARGQDVLAIVDAVPGDLAARLRRAGIARCHTVPMTFAPGAGRSRFLAYTVAIPLAAWRVSRILRRERIDVAQSHIFSTAVVGRLACLLARTPRHVGTIPGPRHLEARLTRHVDRLTWWLDDLTIAGCRRTRDLYVEAGAPDGQVEVVPCGADPRRFDPETADGAAARLRLGIADGVPLVALVAHFYPPVSGYQEAPAARGVGLKGQEDFLAAAKRVLARRPDARFVLAGEGVNSAGEAYRRRLAASSEADAALSGRVVFTGRWDDVPSLLAAADVAVQCSLTENYGGTLEALLMERPTVATRVGGMPEAVRHEETGLLVPPRQPEALADAVLRLLADPVEGARLGRAGRRLVLARFTTEATVDGTDRALRRIAGRDVPSAPEAAT